MTRRIDLLLDTLRMRDDKTFWTVAIREFELDVQRTAAREHAHILRVLAASEQAKARSYDSAGREQDRDDHLERAHALRHAADTIAQWQPSPLRRSADRAVLAKQEKETHE